LRTTFLNNKKIFVIEDNSFLTSAELAIWKYWHQVII